MAGKFEKDTVEAARSERSRQARRSALHFSLFRRRRRGTTRGLARPGAASFVALVVAATTLVSGLVAAQDNEQQDPCPNGLPAPGEAGNRSETRIEDESQQSAVLSCTVLSEATILDSNFSFADFTGADLSGSAWMSSRLEHAILDSTNLANATFVRTSASNAALEGASLRSVDMRLADLTGVDFTAAEIDGLTVAESIVRHVDLSQVEASNVSFVASDLSHANLSGAVLPRADFAASTLNVSNLDRVDLSGAELSGVSLRTASLTAADLAGAVLVGADFRGAELARVDFTGADLTAARFDERQLGTAVLADAVCPDGTLANDNTSFTRGANCEDHLSAPAASPTVDRQDGQVGAATVLVLDKSTSMGLPDGSGRTRLDAAQAELPSLISEVPESVNLGFVSFGGDETPCDVADQLSPGAGRDSILAALAAITIDPDDVPDPDEVGRGTRGTPTALALRTAADLLPTSGARSLLLVSDGESNCTGDPCEAAQDIANQGVALTVNTVGFQITADGRAELECIADATGGVYTDIDESEDLAERIRLVTESTADVVALGDSYASGEGAADFVGAIPDANPCHRAPRNLSAHAVDVVNRSTNVSWTRFDATCSGAVIADLASPQEQRDGKPAGPQLDALGRLAPEGARIVTISIGGNDAGFGKVIEECVIAGAPPGVASIAETFGDSPLRPGETCEERNTFAGFCDDEQQTSDCDIPESERVLRGRFTENYIDTQLAADLGAGYDNLAERLRQEGDRWTDALGNDQADLTRAVSVYVLNYPKILPARGQGDPSCNWVQGSDLGWIDGLWGQANARIEASVNAANERWSTANDGLTVRFELVDVEDSFNGHRLCEAEPGEEHLTAGSASGPWVNGVLSRNAADDVERPYFFHPNEYGHRVMGDRLARSILGLQPPDPQNLPVRPPNPTIASTSPTDSLEPNGTISFSAGPFTPGTEAYVLVASDSQLVGTVEVPRSGSVTETVTLPTNLPPGEHRLIVQGETANGYGDGLQLALTIVEPPPQATTTTTDVRIESPATSDSPPPMATDSPATIASSAPETPLIQADEPEVLSFGWLWALVIFILLLLGALTGAWRWRASKGGTET